MNKITLPIIIGFFLIVSSIFLLLSPSSSNGVNIPPTPSIVTIYVDNDPNENVSARNYTSFTRFISGDNITIDPDYLLNTMTFTVTDQTGSGITNHSPELGKYGVFIPTGTTVTLGNEGLLSELTQAVTPSFADDSDGAYQRRATSTTAGTDAGIRTTNINLFHREHNAKLEAKVQIDATTNARYFIGFLSATALPNSETPCDASLHCAGFFIRTSDTQYQIVTNDGDTTSDFVVYNGGVTENTNVHIFRVFADAQNNRFGFQMDSSVIQYISTEIPAVGIDLHALVMAESGGTNSRNFDIYWIYAENDL